MGKTHAREQFLLQGNREGEKCLYITLSETKPELEAVAVRTAGTCRASRSSSSRSRAGPPGQGRHAVPVAEVELTQLTKLLMEQIQRGKPSRVVLDSLSELRMLAQTPLRYRREVLRLKQELSALGCTVLLLDDRASQGSDVQVHSIVHGALSLNAAPLKYGIFRRSIAVTKMRGVHFREGNHDYVIEKGGLHVFPRLIASEHHTPFTKTGRQRQAQLDTLRRGLKFGTSNLTSDPGERESTISAM